MFAQQNWEPGLRLIQATHAHNGQKEEAIQVFNVVNQMWQSYVVKYYSAVKINRAVSIPGAVCVLQEEASQVQKG